MFEIKNDYEMIMTEILYRKHLHDWRLIDHEENAYIFYEDREIGWAFIIHFDDNGYVIHEREFKI